MDTLPDYGLTSWHRRLEVIAHSVRVKDVAQALARLDVNWGLDDASIELMEDDGWFGLVHENSRVLGYVALDDLESGRTLREATSPIPFDLIVEESSPLLEVIHLFRQSPFFFGLRNNAVSSVMSWQDLDSMLGRIVVMALIMEYELALDDALSPRASEVLATISPSRLKRTHNLHEQKVKSLNGRAGEQKPTLYSCLHLADKAKAARVLSGRTGEAEWVQTRPIRSSFKLIEDVRNDVAHGGSLLTRLPEPKDVAEFFEVLRYSIEWLRQGPLQAG